LSLHWSPVQALHRRHRSSLPRPLKLRRLQQQHLRYSLRQHLRQRQRQRLRLHLQCHHWML